tara:strand:- start:587 stop:979 length:393 start_codon:yes stop_codon:yes gene_type:complete
MRATISFDIDVNEVEGAMGQLVSREAHSLRAAATILEHYIAPRDHLLDEVTEALRLVSDATSQLEQYRAMLVNFERAKHETVLPQDAMASVANIGIAVANLNKFGDFIERLNAQEEVVEDGEENAEPAAG